MRNLSVVWRVFFTTACISSGILALAKAFAPHAHAAPVMTIAGSIKRIVDGDTIRFLDGSERELKVRMLYIDAPESHYVPRPGQPPQAQPYGEEAGRHLSTIIPAGSDARLLSSGLDKYKRTLGVIVTPARLNANLKMIEDGLAVPYVICEKKQCSEERVKKERVALYFKACESARKKQIGIWDAKNPLREAPFEFRLRLSGGKPNKLVGDFQTHALYIPTEYKKVDICKRVFFMKKEDAEHAGYGK